MTTDGYLRKLMTNVSEYARDDDGSVDYNTAQAILQVIEVVVDNKEIDFEDLKKQLEKIK